MTLAFVALCNGCSRQIYLSGTHFIVVVVSLGIFIVYRLASNVFQGVPFGLLPFLVSS